MFHDAAERKEYENRAIDWHPVNSAAERYSIMDGYKVDKTLLTNTEMQDILAGLRSLDSVNGTNRYGQLMEKLSVGSSDFLTGNQSVLIDLSSWYKNSLAPKIEIIRNAIADRKELRFYYYGPKGESSIEKMRENYGGTIRNGI